MLLPFYDSRRCQSRRKGPELLLTIKIHFDSFVNQPKVLRLWLRMSRKPGVAPLVADKCKQIRRT